jgi:hypothetical protein
MSSSLLVRWDDPNYRAGLAGGARHQKKMAAIEENWIKMGKVLLIGR